jgi:hypothetical protein
MARKPERPDPISEGSIADIYRLFFGKLIQYKPPYLSIKDWMEELFDSRNRDITRYVATKAFKMPGLFYEAPLVKVQGVGHRQMNEQAELWVRRNARLPHSIDVECQGGQGSPWQVFNLTEDEWHFVALHCVEAERKRK